MHCRVVFPIGKSHSFAPRSVFSPLVNTNILAGSGDEVDECWRSQMKLILSDTVPAVCGSAISVGAGVCWCVREAVHGESQELGKSGHNIAKRIGVLLPSVVAAKGSVTGHPSACRPRAVWVEEVENKTRTGGRSAGRGRPLQSIFGTAVR